MQYRCNKDLFRYCKGIPDWEKEPFDNGTGCLLGGICKLNPETCGRCETIKDQWDRIPQEEKDRISKPSLTQTIIPINKSNDGCKTKSAKAKKLEAEMAQGSMF